jgi:catechol 2,3-dioxygenase-like lactoylglutathione lyase family enzyme
MSTQETESTPATTPSKMRIGHVGVSVANLEEALEFYKVVLQAEPSEIWVGEGKDYLDHEVGYENVNIRIASFPMPIGYFEVLEYVNPKPGRIDPESYNAGHVHICLDVDDIQAEYERLRDADIGIEFRGDGPSVVPDDDPDYAGYKCLYFRTPDGTTIEIAEVAPIPGDARA